MKSADQLKPLNRNIQDYYPTRGNEEQIIERVDPVVYGSGDPVGEQSLTREQVNQYEQDGFIVIPEVFSEDEVNALFAEFSHLSTSGDLTEKDEVVREPGSKHLRSIFNPHRFSELFDRASRDHRILNKVTQLLGSDAYIHHGRINIKSGLNGKSFPWHSDFETWHAEDGLPHCRVLTAWIMLTENSEFNGPLFIIPGSHKHFVSCAGNTPENNHVSSLRKQTYGVPSIDALQALADKGSPLVSAKGKPGTLILHEGNVMHGSPDNISPLPRTNAFFVYNSVLNTPAEKPFSAPEFRPEFLGSRDFSPLRPVINGLA